MKIKKVLLGKVGYFIYLTLAVITLSELGLRVVNFHEGVSANNIWEHWTFSGPDNWKEMKKRYNLMFDYDKDIGFKRKDLYHTTSFGTGKNKPIRILFIGDSVTQFSDFPYKLGDKFSRKYPNNPIEIINAGVMGYDTKMEYLFLKKYHEKIKPDIIYHQFCLNDFNTTPVVMKNNDSWMAYNAGSLTMSSRIKSPLFQYSKLYQFIVLQSLRMSLKEDSWHKEKRVKENLKKISTLVKNSNYKFKFLIFPYFKEKEDPRFPLIMKISNEVLQKQSIVDLKERLVGEDKKLMSNDGTHLTREGGTLISDKIYSIFEEDVLALSPKTN